MLRASLHKQTNPDSTLTSKSRRRTLSTTATRSETAPTLALDARGGSQDYDHHRLQLDALPLWLLLLLLQPHTGERMSESRR